MSYELLVPSSEMSCGLYCFVELQIITLTIEKCKNKSQRMPCVFILYHEIWIDAKYKLNENISQLLFWWHELLDIKECETNIKWIYYSP